MSSRLHRPFWGRNVLCTSILLGILPASAAFGESVASPQSTRNATQGVAQTTKTTAALSAPKPLLTGAKPALPGVKCIAPTSMYLGDTTIVKAIGGSPVKEHLREFFLVSAGTITVNGKTFTPGHYTIDGSTGIFSTVGMKSGTADIYCHAADDFGQIVSSATRIIIKTHPQKPVVPAPTPKPAPAPAPKPTPAPAPTPAPISTPTLPAKPTVTCVGPGSVNQGDPAQFTANTVTPAKGAIQLSFTTSNGSLVVNGGTATLLTTSLQPGPVTITCTATDVFNQSASAISTLQINAFGEQALTAFQFTDSIGVNIHLHFGGTVYWYAFPDFLRSITALGIHHYRNGIDPWVSQPEYEHAEALARSGLKADWLIDRHDSVQDINNIYANAPNSIDSFESVNEDDEDAGPVLANFTKMLHDTVKANPRTANVPVYAPTVTTLDSIQKLGDLSSFVDAGNMHDYYDPRYPETPAYGGAFFNCGYYGTMSFNACLARVNAPNRPVISTETGYLNGNISDVAAGRYIPRILFKHLQENIMRTFLYEFADETASPNSGIVHLDFTPKPAYTSIKNLVNIFQDVSFTSPGKLPFTISGNTANVEHVLFQKTNGTYLLAVWLGVPSADWKQTLAPSAQNITIQTSVTTGNAVVYSLDDAGNMSSRSGNTTSRATAVSVTDRITVVALPRQ